jgi:hypothetical protein
LPQGESIKLPRWIRLSGSAILIFLIALHISQPALSIDSTTVGLLVLLMVLWLLPYVKSFKLPGGGEIQLRETLAKAEKSLAMANIPAADSVRRMVDVDSASLIRTTLLEQDPNLALAGLRIEIEKKLREIAKTRSFVVPQSAGVNTIVNLLRQRGTLDSELASALLDVVTVCNRAIHGARIHESTARQALTIGEKILDALDAILHEHNLQKGS